MGQTTMVKGSSRQGTGFHQEHLPVPVEHRRFEFEAEPVDPWGHDHHPNESEDDERVVVATDRRVSSR